MLDGVLSLLLLTQMSNSPPILKSLTFLPVPVTFTLHIDDLPNDLTDTCVQENESTLRLASVGSETCLATGHFSELIYETGWNELEIEFDGSLKGAYAGGLVEGLLTGRVAIAHLHNMRSIYSNEDLEALYDYYEEWDELVRGEIAERGETEEEEQYFGQIRMIRAQLEGIYDGINLSGHPISLSDVYFINTDGDLDNLFALLSDFHPHSDSANRCSALIKVTPDDIFFAHATTEAYGEMNRFLKTYTFPTYSLVFSSYPAALSSTDDFSLTSFGLAVMETSLIPAVGVTGSVLKGFPPFMRVQAALRSSRNGREFIETLLKHDSDTYASQWMVMDFKLTEEGLRDGAFYVLETAPHYSQFADFTSYLRTSSFWSSANWPIFTETKKALGRSTPPPSASYRLTQFAALHPHISSISTLQSVMRFNNWAGSYCQDDNPLLTCDPMYAISPRGDLRNTVKMLGGTDTKITSREMMKEGLKMVAVSGPTSQGQPVFEFPEEQQYEYIPQRWEFQWVEYPH